MKKILLFSVTAILAFTACKKTQTTTVDNQVAITPNSKDADAILTQIKELRKSVKASHSTKPFTPLGKIQTAGRYVRDDVSGAITTFKVATYFFGPAYGAAFGFLGGIVGSSFTYINDHYNYSPINPAGNSGTMWPNAYNNGFEKAGFIHNTEVVKTFNTGTTRPPSLDSFIARYYTMYCHDLADSFGLNYNTFIANAPINDIEDITTDLVDASTPEDCRDILYNYNVDSPIVSIIYDFLTDISDPNITSDNTVYTYVSLYISYVNASTTLTTAQKNQLLWSLNIGKYSYALWINNVEE